jgi:hypothetical protein
LVARREKNIARRAAIVARRAMFYNLAPIEAHVLCCKDKKNRAGKQVLHDNYLLGKNSEFCAQPIGTLFSKNSELCTLNSELIFSTRRPPPARGDVWGLSAFNLFLPHC